MKMEVGGNGLILQGQNSFDDPGDARGGGRVADAAFCIWPASARRATEFDRIPPMTSARKNVAVTARAMARRRVLTAWLKE